MFESFKINVFNFIKHKRFKQFLVFMSVAFMFLMLTKLSKTYTEVVEFNVTLSNLPDSHVIVNDSSTLKVVVKSIGFNLFPLQFRNERLRLDASKHLKVFGNSYQWPASKNKYIVEAALGDNFEILSIEPDTMQFQFESMTVKTVPVILNENIDYALGFDSLDELKIEPDSINLIGPSKTLTAIKSVHTEQLNLKNVKRDINQVIQLSRESLDPSIVLSTSEVSINAEVEKFTEGVVEVPVNVINVPSDTKINYFPKRVSVSYYLNLDNYKLVKSSDFIVECSFNELKKSNVQWLTSKLKTIPKLVKSARINQPRIEFIIIE